MHFIVKCLTKRRAINTEKRYLPQIITKKREMKLFKEVKGKNLTDTQIKYISHWLEPYELPTEEEIKNIIGKFARRFCKGFDANIISHDSAKAITNLLK